MNGRKRSKEAIRQDLEDLKNMGYTVVILTPYHWHVKHKGIVINVWPTVGKYMKAYDIGGSKQYKDILKSCKNEFTNIQHVEPPKPIQTSKEREDAQKEVREFQERMHDIINKNMTN